MALRGMSVRKVIKKNLDAMIKMSLKDGAAVLLIGVALPPNYGKRYINSFKEYVC
jgi:acyl-CoA thioesterase-1